MKKLLRCKACERFLSPEGKWVEDVRQAWRFETREEAEQAFQELELSGVDLYYSFEDEFDNRRWDFNIPFHEARTTAA